MDKDKKSDKKFQEKPKILPKNEEKLTEEQILQRRKQAIKERDEFIKKRNEEIKKREELRIKKEEAAMKRRKGDIEEDNKSDKLPDKLSTVSDYYDCYSYSYD